MYDTLCRICLSEDGLIHISNSKLYNVYEKLTNIKLTVSEGMSLIACYICHVELKKCYQLMIKASRAGEVLQDILSCGIKESDDRKPKLEQYRNDLRHSFSYGELLHLSVPPEVVHSVSVKEEIQNTVDQDHLKEIVTQENDCKAEEIEGVCENDELASDSEDDLPLKSISKNSRFKERVQIKKRARKRCRDLKVDALEIILTKEQQHEEVFARSKGLNYLNSPLKCELCYKGFIDANAYNNHMDKHDERAGPFECDICRMRYPSARHLRMHTTTAHARLYRCNRCTHVSHTRNQAREHDKWHGGHTYECKLCSRKFGKSTSYLTHMRKSHPTEYVCNICGRSCLGKHGLLMHKSKTHRGVDEVNPCSEEPSSDCFCVECNVQFISSEAWKRHILTSVNHSLANESNTRCKICGQEFNSCTSLSTHMREHEKTLLRSTTVSAATGKLTELTCEECGAKFVNRSKLHTHVKRIHLGVKYNKNIVCEVCGKKCVSNASLRYHQRTHTGEKPYGCERCEKRFADNNQLRIHTRTHTGERPYCCALCGKRFTQKPALNRHYRIHTGAKPYECQFCSKSFSQSNSMKLHVRTVHLKQAPNRKSKSIVQEES